MDPQIAGKFVTVCASSHVLLECAKRLGCHVEGHEEYTFSASMKAMALGAFRGYTAHVFLQYRVFWRQCERLFEKLHAHCTSDDFQVTTAEMIYFMIAQKAVKDLNERIANSDQFSGFSDWVSDAVKNDPTCPYIPFGGVRLYASYMDSVFYTPYGRKEDKIGAMRQYLESTGYVREFSGLDEEWWKDDEVVSFFSVGIDGVDIAHFTSTDYG